MFINVLVEMWKNGLTHQIMMKEEEKDQRPFPVGKKQKVVGLMKNKKGCKVFTRSVAVTPKTYSYWMQKGHHEIEDTEFISAEGLKSG